MAITKRVIILEQEASAPLKFHYIMWADVPLARQPFYANAAATSLWKNAAAADITAIQNGSVVEQDGHIIVNQGDTLATVEALLQTAWTAFQAQINAANPWVRYGSFMDTTNGWTAGGVA